MSSETIGIYLRGNGHRYFIRVSTPSPATNRPADADTITVKAYLTSDPYGTALSGTEVDPLTALTDTEEDHGFWGLVGASAADAVVAPFPYIYEEYFHAATGARLGEPRRLRVIGW